MGGRMKLVAWFGICLAVAACFTVGQEIGYKTESRMLRLEEGQLDQMEAMSDMLDTDKMLLEKMVQDLENDRQKNSVYNLAYLAGVDALEDLNVDSSYPSWVPEEITECCWGNSGYVVQNA